MTAFITTSSRKGPFGTEAEMAERRRRYAEQRKLETPEQAEARRAYARQQVKKWTDRNRDQVNQRRRENYKKPENIAKVSAKRRTEKYRKASAERARLARAPFLKTPEEKAAIKAEISKRIAEAETPEQRAYRLRNTFTKEAKIKQQQTGLGFGERHWGALTWSLRDPNGAVYQFRNLKNFIRNNPHLFTAEQLRPIGPEFGASGIPLDRPTLAYASLSWLSPRRKHCAHTAMGWTWHISGREPETYLSSTNDMPVHGEASRPVGQ